MYLYAYMRAFRCIFILSLIVEMQVHTFMSTISDGIFGYSMLYPYSDNFLDDETISKEDKIAFQVILVISNYEYF